MVVSRLQGGKNGDLQLTPFSSCSASLDLLLACAFRLFERVCRGSITLQNIYTWFLCYMGIHFVAFCYQIPVVDEVWRSLALFDVSWDCYRCQRISNLYYGCLRVCGKFKYAKLYGYNVQESKKSLFCQLENILFLSIVASLTSCMEYR